MRKYEEGITLIQTVVAVVMIGLIAAFAVFNSTDTIKETKIAKTYNEIVTIKKALEDYLILEEDGMKNFSEYKEENLDGYPEINESISGDSGDVYYFDFKGSGQNLCDKLEIRNIENNYIVDIKKFDNIRVFLTDGIKIGEEKYYTDTQIIEKYNEIFAGR